MTDRNNTPSSSTPPLVPPTLEDDSFARLRLLRSRRVGVVTYYRMLRDYGTARAALEALPDVARAAGVKDYRICPENVVHAELRAAKAANARLIAHDCAAYPPHLAELDDAPPFLWAIGDIELLHRPLVSIVGARNASSLGTRMARALASGLGEAGFTVVSGLARGIDAAAHLATLQSGTIAVQAGGVDVIYPVENTTLAQDIAAQGLRISEQPMGLQPMARHFPSRNRIIAGLSRATVVVEAAAKSGSLITARDALDQGREVLAVPGHPFDARAAGCNMLIRDGAALVRNAADVIDQLGPAKAPATCPPTSPAAAPAPQRDIAALHTDILSRLGPSPVAEDQLLRDLAVAPGIATPVLVELELNGHILRHAGGLVSRAD